MRVPKGSFVQKPQRRDGKFEQKLINERRRRGGNIAGGGADRRNPRIAVLTKWNRGAVVSFVTSLFPRQPPE